MTNDFLQNFPWATLLVLSISLLFAVLVVPFMQFYFIRKPHKSQQKTKKSFSFLDILQNVYDKLIDICFKFPKTTLLIGILLIVVGCYMISLLPQKLMLSADSNKFAFEISKPEGTSLKKTFAIADSLYNIKK